MDTRAQTTLRFGFVAFCAAALALLAFGQGSYSTSPTSKMEIGPHPRDFVLVKEGTTYIVPTGKIFVLTALGGRDTPADCCPTSQDWRVVVDGITACRASRYRSLSGTSMTPAPPGLSLDAGKKLDVTGGDDGENDGRAWGYLADPLPPGVGWNVVRVPYAPHPSDMVNFGTGSFFIVPPGKIFVLTGLGGQVNSYALESFRVNAQTEVTSSSRTSAPSGTEEFGRDVPSVRPVPLGFSAGAGSILEVISESGASGTAWGYLADE